VPVLHCHASVSCRRCSGSSSRPLLQLLQA
jgi:hypothetical protein